MKNLLSKPFLLLFLLCIYGHSHYSQSINEKPKTNLKDKIFFGGNFGFQFGTVTLIDISPLIGYKITDKLSAGIGGTYLHYDNRKYFFTTYIYGGRIFGNYSITNNVYTHLEYEILNIEQYDFPKNRININSILAGLGYRQQVGRNTSINILALWNLNESSYSPYVNPIIRGGINFGL